MSVIADFGTIYEQSRFCIPKWLMGDERRFKQVLINLIKNAMKFTNQGSIKIKTIYRPLPLNMLEIEVKDTGVGIAAEDINAIFTRFGKL